MCKTRLYTVLYYDLRNIRMRKILISSTKFTCLQVLSQLDHPIELLSLLTATPESANKPPLLERIQNPVDYEPVHQKLYEHEDARGFQDVVWASGCPRGEHIHREEEKPGLKHVLKDPLNC